uniref:Putative secreted protein n=1 Tax=Ixodes ricinus TaxID=34613 RepID=A0A147BTL8_IXORI
MLWSILLTWATTSTRGQSWTISLVSRCSVKRRTRLKPWINTSLSRFGTGGRRFSASVLQHLSWSTFSSHGMFYVDGSLGFCRSPPHPRKPSHPRKPCPRASLLLNL